MENCNKILLVFIYIFFIKCTDTPLKINSSSYIKSKSKFDTVLKIDSLANHFPNVFKTNNYYYETAFPSCKSQIGYFYLIDNKTDYKKELDILYKSVEYRTSYNVNENIMINLFSFKHNFSSCQKCNFFYDNKLPIPYFESFNFRMGEIINTKTIDKEKKYRIVYTIPKDLEVYVIHSESGNIWIKDCNAKRPVSLKGWKHGYSKGFAVSEKENIIVYWTMLW